MYLPPTVYTTNTAMLCLMKLWTSKKKSSISLATLFDQKGRAPSEDPPFFNTRK